MCPKKYKNWTNCVSHCKQVILYLQLATCHSPALFRRVSIECLMSYNISICLCNIIYRQHSSTWELTEGRHDKTDHVTSESISCMCVVLSHSTSTDEVLTWWTIWRFSSLPRLVMFIEEISTEWRAEVIPWVQHRGCNNSQNMEIERAFTARGAGSLSILLW